MLVHDHLPQTRTCSKPPNRLVEPIERGIRRAVSVVVSKITDLLRPCTCRHTGIEAVDRSCCLTQSQISDTGPPGPSTVPITPGVWHGSIRKPVLELLVHHRVHVPWSGVMACVPQWLPELYQWESRISGRSSQAEQVCGVEARLEYTDPQSRKMLAFWAGCKACIYALR